MDEQPGSRAGEDLPMANLGMLSLGIRDAGVLYAYYMPWVRGGGLFIPTQRRYRLGDEVFLLLHLMNEPERIPVVGKVVFISPHQGENRRPQGIGIQFDDKEGKSIRERIERYLVAYRDSKQPTQTF
ncbi:PilZ domain-containing protein [Methyloparacoccus murrellii]|jgi:type IV pilus assembly protein PilZ